MKKFIISTLAMMSLIGTLYAGGGCGSCKKGDSTEKTDTPAETTEAK